LFATQNINFLQEKDTQHTNKITKKYFVSWFGYKVNVPFNFHSRQTQVDMQVSSAILFHVSLFNHVIIEKALWQITNKGSTSSVQSLLSGSNSPVAPMVAGLVTLQLFQNCLPRISVVFPVCFLVFGAVMPL